MIDTDQKNDRAWELVLLLGSDGTIGHQASKVEPKPMYSVTFNGAVLGAVLFGLLMFVYFVYHRRRRCTQRLLITELLKRYFEGDISTDQLDQRSREIVNRHFIRSAEFHSLAIAGFQRAVDARLAGEPHSKEEEGKLLSLLAALKNEFGLTDRYQVEAWRAGRD